MASKIPRQFFINIIFLLLVLKCYTVAFKLSIPDQEVQQPLGINKLPIITNSISLPTTSLQISTKDQSLDTNNLLNNNSLPIPNNNLLIITKQQPDGTIMNTKQRPVGTNMNTKQKPIDTNTDIKQLQPVDTTTSIKHQQIVGTTTNTKREKRSIGKYSLKILSNLEATKDQNNEIFDEPENKTVTLSTNEAVNFMKKFGYVPAGDDTAGFIFSAETFTEKLKLVQKFGAIPETGELDEATIELMSSPRCGVHDVEPEEGKRRRKRFILGSNGWNKRELTYTLGNWSPQLMSKENTQMELKRAFEHWSKYSNLKFTEIDSNEADIIIFFASYSHYDNYPFDGQGGILAHAYYPYEFGSYGGDIHFDESEEWKFKPEDEHSGLDFFTVAVHEIGHSLGLAHSHVPTSIMFPYYKGIEQNFALDYDDIMGMWELYIRRKLDGDDEYFKNAATSTTPSTPTTTTSSYDATQNDEGDDNVRYHGDSETVDEHEERQKGTEAEDSPSLPPLIPDGEDDFYERERKWREEEDRRRKEDDERKKVEEEERRKRWEEDKRREAEEEERRREEEHRRREEDARRRHEWENRGTEAPPTKSKIPDICDGEFDSVALLRDELFIFKGKYMWRYERQGSLILGYPALIRNLFSDLPDTLQGIDAAYERKNDSNIVFFIGNQYFVHDGQKIIEDTPKPLTSYEIPEEISKIDAIFYWPKNRRTYIFSRNVYWRRDDFTDKMDENYPRGIEKWNGLPKDLDAAVTDIYGTSYFFKKGQVWQYDNQNVRPTHNSPSKDLRRWTGC